MMDYFKRYLRFLALSISFSISFPLLADDDDDEPDLLAIPMMHVQTVDDNGFDMANGGRLPVAGLGLRHHQF